MASAARRVVPPTVAALSPEAIQVVKATAPVVAPLAADITKNFYRIMLSQHKELYQFFNKSNQRKGTQPMALANAVVGYASNIENLGVLVPALQLMAVKHCALQVQAPHYQIVHDCLMQSIGEILGDAVTPEIASGWSEAVMFLGNTLISTEQQLYDQAAERAGGWRGWKDFVLAKKTPLTNESSVFRFVKADGEASTGIDFTPGQYLTLKTNLKDEEGDFVAPRHYTIINEPGADYLECAVKKIPGGRISTYLNDDLKEGDKVQLSPPFGVFQLTEAQKKAEDSVVLLSAGIGITPMMAFAKQLRHVQPAKNIKHVHVAKSEEFPLKAPSAYPSDVSIEFRASEGPNDQPSMEELLKLAGDVSDKQVLVCGPSEFMQQAVPFFRQHAKGVEYENFGSRINV